MIFWMVIKIAYGRKYSNMTLINFFVFELYSVYSIFKYTEDSKEFIVGISERNLDEILTIILLKSPYILTQ